MSRPIYVFPLSASPGMLRDDLYLQRYLTSKKKTDNRFECLFDLYRYETLRKYGKFRYLIKKKRAMENTVCQEGAVRTER